MSERRTETSHFRIRRPYVVALSGAVSLSLGGSYAATGNALAAYETLYQELAYQSCPKVAKDQLTETGTILDTVLEQRLDDGPRKFIDNFDGVQSIADKNGFSLHDPLPTVDSLFNTDSTAAMMLLANRYMSNFGVEIVSHPPSEGVFERLKYDNYTYDRLSLETADADTIRRSLLGIILSYSFLPEELVKGSSNTIVLVEDIVSEDVELGGFAKSGIGTLYVDVDSVDVFLALHEALHPIDERLCRLRPEVDPQFTDIETSSPQEFVSPYAYHSSVNGRHWEDRVETMMKILTFDTALFESLSSQPAIDKASLQLARLDRENPGFADYIVQTHQFLLNVA